MRANYHKIANPVGLLRELAKRALNHVARGGGVLVFHGAQMESETPETGPSSHK